MLPLNPCTSLAWGVFTARVKIVSYIFPYFNPRIEFLSPALDISADLPELTRCPVALVSAGVKSILDVGRSVPWTRSTTGSSISLETNAGL